MRILVVEDDKKIAAFLEKGLQEAGFTVDVCHDGISGLSLALTEPYEAAVVDIMLPGLDGLSLIEKIRGRGIVIPVLILSARQSVDDRIEGLQRGGDDYMVKPFSFNELLARVQALLRRGQKGGESGKLTVGELQLDLLKREVRRQGKKIELPAKEYALLELMMRNPGRVLSKTSILERIYEYNFDPQTNVVDVLVCRLRNRVDKEYEVKLIHTVRGMGYVLRTE
ncbi:MAG: response regulator transcription factor [Proteobacteria bacterium]|nr:response regulator transcription factor [Pseudomonadota bacterium]MBU1233930.1 response regulator transcription factor [Pseudomonadota bacterium]MBU1420297.1 response regulator transcription factor [Pseudomonadota bacterium]MBU1455626.1 response regulator transcription factor [Pseudomonadota bacterium]